MKKEEIKTIEPVSLERRIFLIRGQKVMIDSDLAELYQVETKQLNRAIKRNKDRFPKDFCFRLTREETENLRCQFGTSSLSFVNRSQIVTESGDSNLRLQIATSSLEYGGRRYLPYVFNEHGVAMLSSVLRSKRAVQMNIFIIRAFVKLREMLATHKDLAHKLEELERIQDEQGDQLRSVYSIVKQLIDKPIEESKPIGFHLDN